MIRIKIPATSANFGSGFDCLGGALGLYNTVDIEEWDCCSITSADGVKIPMDESNLIYTTARELFVKAGRKFSGLKISQTNSIPLARGLGSSSACIVGGLLGANALLGGAFPKAELIDMAAVLEGHPDNSTPAFTGGFVTAVLDGGKVFYNKSNISQELLFVSVIPDFELKTAEARRVLPKEIQMSDAVYNLSRSALLSVAMANGNFEQIKIGVGDRLHQPHRLPLIKGGTELLEHMTELGALGAYISGAGSTLMAIGKKSDSQMWSESLTAYLQKHGICSWKVELLSADNAGAITEII